MFFTGLDQPELKGRRGGKKVLTKIIYWGDEIVSEFLKVLWHVGVRTSTMKLHKLLKQHRFWWNIVTPALTYINNRCQQLARKEKSYGKLAIFARLKIGGEWVKRADFGEIRTKDRNIHVQDLVKIGLKIGEGVSRLSRSICSLVRDRQIISNGFKILTP